MKFIFPTLLSASKLHICAFSDHGLFNTHTHAHSLTLAGKCTLFANHPACKDRQRGSRGDEKMAKW